MGSMRRIPKDLRAKLATHGVQPSDLVLYVNSACNLRCRHCYVGDSLLNSAARYAGQEILDFIESFDSIDRLTIVGGEPLLHPDINMIVSNLPYEAIGLVRLTTNLTTLSTFDYDRLRAKPLTLCISIDGNTSDLHDEIRGQGAFARTVDNVGRVLSSGYTLEVTHTLTRINLPRFSEYLEFSRALGVRQLNLHRISLQGNALRNRYLKVSPSEWVQFRSRLEELSTERPVHLNSIYVRYPVLFVTRDEFADLVRCKAYHHHTEGSFYGGGDRIVLYPDGRIYISSEAFGTESFIADISTGEFVWNDNAGNELKMFRESNAAIPSVNAMQEGDENYPIVLSVSYKRGGFL
jgi:MoaA/NifB/PqqE/SkfB family radical SAM enzyme